jgi:hypothetical protein
MMVMATTGSFTNSIIAILTILVFINLISSISAVIFLYIVRDDLRDIRESVSQLLKENSEAAESNIPRDSVDPATPEESKPDVGEISTVEEDESGPTTTDISDKF